MNHFYISSLFSLYAQVTRAVNESGKQKNDNDFLLLPGVGIVFANSVAGNLYTEPTIRQDFSDCVLDGGDEYTGHL